MKVLKLGAGAAGARPLFRIVYVGKLLSGSHPTGRKRSGNRRQVLVPWNR